MADFVYEFALVCYGGYRALNLADHTAVPRWEVLDGKEILEEGIEGIQNDIPYLCIWEITETLDEEGKPIPQKKKAPEYKPPTNKTGVPAFTKEDLNPDVSGGNNG
ncbi:MAG: hypothetical protein WEC39_00610 [Patescibacteria group bacterium]